MKSPDAFILAKIEQNGLTPAPDAEKAILKRRLSFDLIGLPPSDSSDMSDLSDYVDSLLNSPHFGEKWGRHWLDVARYAESNGNDGLSRNPSFPHAWRYRDYVIRAFNEDLPYDRFIAEQIAGDLLPADSPAERDRQLIATGLLALGAKPAKAMNDNFEMDVIADQINVIGSGILGLSVGCARCHDHKTDPIPTRDSTRSPASSKARRPCGVPRPIKASPRHKHRCTSFKLPQGSCRAPRWSNWFFLLIGLAMQAPDTTMLPGVVNNLIAVSLGNMAGGTLLVAGVYWAAYLRGGMPDAKG